MYGHCTQEGKLHLFSVDKMIVVNQIWLFFCNTDKQHSLAILFLIITRKGACIRLLKVFKFIDIGERLQCRIELPELLD